MLPLPSAAVVQETKISEPDYGISAVPAPAYTPQHRQDDALPQLPVRRGKKRAESLRYVGTITLFFLAAVLLQRVFGGVHTSEDAGQPLQTQRASHMLPMPQPKQQQQQEEEQQQQQQQKQEEGQEKKQQLQLQPLQQQQQRLQLLTDPFNLPTPLHIQLWRSPTDSIFSFISSTYQRSSALLGSRPKESVAQRLLRQLKLLLPLLYSGSANAAGAAAKEEPKAAARPSAAAAAAAIAAAATEAATAKSSTAPRRKPTPLPALSGGFNKELTGQTPRLLKTNREVNHQTSKKDKKREKNKTLYAQTRKKKNSSSSTQ